MAILVSLPNRTSSIRDEVSKLVIKRTIEANQHVIVGAPTPHDLPEPIISAAEAQPTSTLPICIVGAGVAGLYTAMILDSLNIEYDILEANDRIGGRIFTHRFNGDEGKKAPVNTPARYDYIDIGAMRYPNIPFMKRVFDLFDTLKMNDLLIKYEYSSPYQWKMYNNVRHNVSDDDKVEEDYDIYKVSEGKGGAVPDKWVEKGVDNVASNIFAPFAEAFKTLPFPEAWKALTEHDALSTRAYLLRDDMPEAVVEWLETFQTATGLYNDAFVESTMDAMDFGTPAPTKDSAIKGEARKFDWYCIDGGSDNMTSRMVDMIRSTPRTGVRVTKIGSSAGGQTMDVESVASDGNITKTKTYSQVICTVPLGCLAAIDIPTDDLSYTKRLAIRALNYDTSTKIALRFEKRWWEDPTLMKGKPIKGGISSTDLPIRTCVYPSYGWDVKEGDLPGVLLASYTWAQDAQRLGGLAGHVKGSTADKLLVDLTLRNLSELHGVSIEDMGPLKDHFAYNWHTDENARGAFALFGPGQFGQPSKGNSLFAAMHAPGAHGKLHIAGEATSVHHAWVLGALNSAWRAVYNALGMYGDKEAKEMRDLLEEKWGLPDEINKEDLGSLAILGNSRVI